jgi:hypothetical protein
MISLDRIATDICRWWRRRRLMKASPDYAYLYRKENEARAKHQPTRVYSRARVALMTELLRGEIK